MTVCSISFLIIQGCWHRYDAWRIDFAMEARIRIQVERFKSRSDCLMFFAFIVINFCQ
jgi:hypothetical protein